jgi:nickel superoxide dismutase
MRFIKPVYAHCDVPCGIYETDSMKHAAATCLRMIEKVEALGDLDDKNLDQQNQFVRMIAQKEVHAQKCKDQLYLLWSDYFKPVHLEKFPDLHDKFWQATKQCGLVKQTFSKDNCNKLVELVTEIDQIFVASK